MVGGKKGRIQVSIEITAYLVYTKVDQKKDKGTSCQQHERVTGK
jgi:hypothetical protein